MKDKNKKILILFLILILLGFVTFISFSKKPDDQILSVASISPIGPNHDSTSTQKLKPLLLNVKHPSPKSIEDNDKNENWEKDIQAKWKKSYCLLQNFKLAIPYSKKSGFAGFIGPEINNDGSFGDVVMNFAIEDSACPFGKYSVVSARMIDGKWKKEIELDCRTASPKDLFLSFGLQQSIELKDLHPPEEFYLSINGPGLFVTLCSGQVVLSRWGAFVMNKDHHLINKNGCSLANDKLLPVKVSGGDQIAEGFPYCFKRSRECIPLVQTKAVKKLDAKFLVDMELLIAGGRVTEQLKKIISDGKQAYTGTQIFNDSREILDDPTMLETGISSEAFDEITSDFSCEK